MTQFILNDKNISTDIASGSTLLDFIRYHQHLRGTKIGCREGDCGACTILVGENENGRMKYRSMCSCLTPLGNIHGKHIVTIEGVNMQSMSPVQSAIVNEGGTQCGFCTVGFVLSLTGYVLSDYTPTLPNAIASIDGNICRCTGYKSLERAAETITQKLQEKPHQKKLEWLVKNQFIPKYFLTIPSRLSEIANHSLFKTMEHLMLGGGTDLLVQRPEAIAKTDSNHLFDLPELNRIEINNHTCYIGAAVTAQDIRDHKKLQEHIPNLVQYLKLVSSTPIRNMGTIGGNFINASPIGDLTIFFLALNAKVHLVGKTECRTLYLHDFYKGYKQMDLKPTEYLSQISFLLPKDNHYFNFEKVSKRTYLDIASVNTACLLKIEDDFIIEARISAGGVAAIPKYLQQSSSFLIGKTITSGTIKLLLAKIQEEISPISDARGTATYKRLLLRQLVIAHFITFFPKQMNLQILTQEA